MSLLEQELAKDLFEKRTKLTEARTSYYLNEGQYRFCDNGHEISFVDEDSKLKYLPIGEFVGAVLSAAAFNGDIEPHFAKPGAVANTCFYLGQLIGGGEKV